MNSEQVLHFSRIRLAMREMGVEFDLKRAVAEREYLNEILVLASNHASPHIQESAYVLGASFRLTSEYEKVASNSGANSIIGHPQVPSFSRFSEADLLPELTSTTSDTVESIEAEAAEPAAIAYYAEREAIMRKYIAGLR